MAELTDNIRNITKEAWQNVSILKDFADTYLEEEQEVEQTPSLRLGVEERYLACLAFVEYEIGILKNDISLIKMYPWSLSSVLSESVGRSIVMQLNRYFLKSKLPNTLCSAPSTSIER